MRMSLKNVLWLNIKNLLSKSNGKISFATNFWASSDYNVFMEVTGHWIDEDWNLRATTLEFKRLSY